MANCSASKSVSFFRNIFYQGRYVLGRSGHDLSSTPPRLYSSTNSSIGKNPAKFFFDPRVQTLLKELHRSDLSKVFRQRKEGQAIKEPEYRFLTAEELEEEMKKTERKAMYFLQMPPVLKPREEIHEIVSEDPALQGLDNSNYIFTDITYGIPEHVSCCTHCTASNSFEWAMHWRCLNLRQERLIVVREPDGILRKAYWDERHRMNHAYFPVEGRTMHIPKMFSEEHIQGLLDRSEFEYVLDRACLQFEPDDPTYISVASKVYEFIDENSKYESLRGTRHFGSMIFYLIFNGKLDNLLEDSLSSFRIADSVLMIQVHYIMNPDLKCSNPQDPEDTNFILEYIEQHSKTKAILSQKVYAYLDLKLPKESESNI